MTKADKSDHQRFHELDRFAARLTVAKPLCKTAEELSTLHLLIWLTRQVRDEVEERIGNRTIRRRFLSRRIGQIIR